MTAHFSSGSFIAGIILGVLLAGAWFLAGSPENVFLPSSTPDSANTESATPESGALTVADQPAGSTVFIESVTVPVSSVWIAVREMSGNDLRNVLGAARVSDLRSAVSVSLLRATEPNRSYAIELYRDDNNGAFDLSMNSVYVDFDTGARVVAYFKTTN